MGVYEALKDAVAVARKADDIELIQTLYDAQKEALDLLDLSREKDEKIRDLEAEVERLKESVRLKGDVVEQSGWYFLTKDDGSWKYPPLCPRCWQVDARPVYLQRVPGPKRMGMTCPQCQATVGRMPAFSQDKFNAGAA